jgi:hypothetical protein
MSNEQKTLQQLDTKTDVETYYTDAQDMLNFKEVGITLEVQNMDGSDSTLNVTIQQCSENSENDDRWHDLYSFTEATDTGSQFKYIPDGDTPGFARFLRGKVVVGGSSPEITFQLLMIGKA